MNEAATDNDVAIPRMRAKFENEARPFLMEKFEIKNRLAVPRFEKIVVNMGVGAAKESKELLGECAGHLATLSGQKPVITKARKSIAGFKLREGMQVGLKVTLRRQRMWEFLDRLITLAIPRVRDFRGLSRKAFDGRGNYSFGLNEQSVFPEIDLDSVKNVQGMNITIVTTAGDDGKGEALLQQMGMPFQKA
jgi:large subunit ribosomal protein L5